MAAFNTELEGESLAVIGTVDELRIDEEYLREWEEEIKDNSNWHGTKIKITNFWDKKLMYYNKIETL